VRQNVVVVLVVYTLFLYGCPFAPEPATQSTTPGGAAQAAAQTPPVPAWKRRCEAYATGPVEITYEDAPGGSAVIYRSPGSEAGLRERAREVAKFHNSSAAKTGVLHDLSSVPHRVDVEDIEGGVKLVVRAKSVRTTDLDRLRWSVQQDVQMKQKDGCQSGQEAL